MRVEKVHSNQRFGEIHKAKVLLRDVISFEKDILPAYTKKFKSPIKAFYDKPNFDFYIFTKEDAFKFDNFIKSNEESSFFCKNHDVVHSNRLDAKSVLEYLKNFEIMGDTITCLQSLKDKFLN